MSTTRKERVLSNLDPEIEKRRREKIRKANTGKKRSKSVRKKIGQSVSLHYGWIPEMAAFVRKNYRKMTNQEIADIVGMTRAQVLHKIAHMGLKRRKRLLSGK